MRQAVIHFDTEDRLWVVEVPSLPGCFSQGKTKEEAFENIRAAIDTWIDAAGELEMEVPAETFDVQVCLV